MSGSKKRFPQPPRRCFLAAAGAGALSSRLGAAGTERAVVSIVKVRNGDIESAVERAIDLLGGMGTIARGKERILLKPNLVSPDANATTNRAVVAALARLMKAAGKDVSIGEGSAAAAPFNVRGTEFFRTTNRTCWTDCRSRFSINSATASWRARFICR